ncbi:TRAP transporter small permease subunit [Pseudodesulfovibrio sp. zrk46]|uniref:TRAP transporter small permease subunit n=1 Tax=Pseudodesulfovibrio sp. zrk46 TaxID=2725288 RepID=UPI001449E3AE|nr:TRAP transporter small permease subunit [Pseudodesulfovibrio sp. zrk46]QJB56795.1 TRAP transporter small permease subunit [Pseudodesulfovibrio sp. zrk46]
MPKAIRLYVKYVDAINTRVGQVTLYLVFVMMAILLYSSIARTIFDSPIIWGVEMAQFTMAAYYLLGGGFSMLLRAHVRMDVFYSKWSEKRRATTDCFTSVCMIFYLVMLLYGGISSTAYSIQYNQMNYSAWGPPMSPIKVIMVIGIFLMLLQSISNFFKDVAKATGREL